ncbi:MAG TPA: dihydrolipoamide acetyltransferase family protein [Candidatus Binatia bacterium]|nr:dihydrolipoamide acetyltransferase family protein [Candidatus Binatia bacterium]
MAIEILMPRLSDTMEEGKILKWLKKVGDKIEVGDIIAEVETDKADMEMEALDDGVLVEIRIQEGESAPVNTVIAILSEDGAVGVSPPEQQKVEVNKLVASTPPPLEASETKRPAAEQSRAEQPTLENFGRQPSAAPERKVRELRESRTRRETPEPAPAERRLFASPVVKRMAQEQGIDLSQVRGSGPGGRIVKQDLDAYASQAQPAALPSQLQAQPESAAPTATRTGRKEPFSRIRATIAKRMAESMREIPHFYVTSEIDMSEAVRLRAALKASDRVSVDVTYTHVLIKAVAIALQRHPRLNASFAEDGREFKAEINIGLAVALDDGLIVPVLHDCDKLSLLDIAAQANALVERARSGKPIAEDLSGGTFTISNLGMLPVEHFTAIINPPQGAILAVGTIKERPVVRNGEVRVAHTMMITLSCDHRILDGMTGGQFLAEVKKLLENPVGLMV